MSNPREYEVRHNPDNFPPHTIAGAPDVPTLIRVLYGHLSPAERAEFDAAVALRQVVTTPPLPWPATPQGHNDYSTAGTPSGLPDARAVSVLDRAG